MPPFRLYTGWRADPAHWGNFQKIIKKGDDAAHHGDPLTDAILYQIREGRDARPSQYESTSQLPSTAYLAWESATPKTSYSGLGGLSHTHCLATNPRLRKTFGLPQKYNTLRDIYGRSCRSSVNMLTIPERSASSLTTLSYINAKYHIITISSVADS